MRRRSDSGVWWASPHVAAFIALMPTVLAVFLLAHEMTLHDVIGGVTFQQAGVNFASSIALSKGQLPYDNFTLTQPPGMSILLLPFAWAAHGSPTGAYTAARIFTILVAVVDVYLVAFISRLHGISAAFIGGVLFAIFPNAFHATASVMLEPYLVFFCLLAFCLFFAEGQMATGGRLVAAGVLVGFAVTIKPWAIVPAVALLICAAIEWREALLRYLAGLLGGIVVPCIVFFLASPGSFVHDVVGAEIGGGTGRSFPTGATSRLAELLGLGPPVGIAHPNGTAVFVGAIIVLLVLTAAVLRATTATLLDWSLLGTALILALVAFFPSHLPVAYTYFAAAFGAIAIANAVGTLISVSSAVSVGTGDVSSTVAAGLTFVAVAAGIAVIAIGAPKESDFWTSYFVKHGTDPSGIIAAQVPKGACVVSNNPEALILANRFAGLPTTCPYVVDPAGIEKANANGAATSADVAAWEQILEEARYLVIAPGQPPLPTSPAMTQYFRRNYQIIYQKNYVIYLNINTLPPP